MTFKIRHEGGEGANFGKKGIGCSSQREQHVQSLVGEKDPGLVEAQKGGQCGWYTVVKGRNRRKGQTGGRGQITQGFVNCDKEFGS